VTQIQSDGIGSRGDRWIGEEGNLFLSFAIKSDDLPQDLPKNSVSIYFAYLMKMVLESFGSHVWLKWPNDFYIKDKKAGGVITSLLKGEIVLCSMGINLKKAPENFEIIDVKVEKNRLIEEFFLKIEQDIFWQDIFRRFEIEFEKSRDFFYHDREGERVSLRDAKLEFDGSILINGRKVYSLR
jgi:BirA family biotin operon repressor/biotin-[acetyl-CoA-carboxylase] ligase